MELVFAVLICFAWIVKKIYAFCVDMNFARQRRVYDDIAKDVLENYDTSVKIQSALADSRKRIECFDIVDNEMKIILGDDWRMMFDNFHSDWIFKNRVGRREYLEYQFLPAENIVYHLMLAYNGRALNKFKLHNIGGMSKEDAHAAIRRTCLAIEKILKRVHPELESDLDMLEGKIGECEVIIPRYYADYLEISGMRRLEI